MIPSDLVSRLRVLLDTPLPQVGAVAPAHPDTPELAPGQRFTAQILNPLPDGTYKALVAGRTMTLSLPESVKSGDVLELEVSHNTGQTVVAQQTAPLAQSLPRPQISLTGQVISQLLTGRYGTPDPAPLNRGAPLLPQPPQRAAELVPVLAQAVTDSGMFYEAHQAQWINGSLPLTQLFREPQAQLNTPPTPPAPSTAPSPTPSDSPHGEAPVKDTAGKPAPNAASPTAPEVALHASAGAPPGSPAPAHAAADGQSGPLQSLVPQQLAPLVHNQLESLATQVLAWQGQVWPGQTMQWSIENNDHQARGGGADDEGDTWQTTVRLTLPRLGSVAVQMHITPVGVAMRIETPDAAAADQLRAALPSLSDALAGAGVPLVGSAVVQDESS